MKTHLSIFLLATILLGSCKENTSSKVTQLSPIEQQETTAYTSSNHPGKKLMENQCYVCHNPTADHDGRIAPPMVAIKSHYKIDDISKEAFKNAIWHFVEKPTIEKSKMKGAVRRFNLMPYQAYNEKDVKLIADYIYDFEIEEPEWFKKHIEEESKGKMKYRNDGKQKKVGKASVEPKTAADLGMEYALNTKKELGKNLMGTIQKKGTKEAVTFCNKEAYPITDRMAKEQNATIKRVSDQPRNIENAANSKELSFIQKFKDAIANGKSYEPITEMKNDRTYFYYPITTNSMCLQCHGVPSKDITDEVYATIATLYPDDKAINYKVNEVRGLWSISYKQ
jgi:hypothetical protein